MFTKSDFIAWLIIGVVVFLCGGCMVMIDKAEDQEWQRRNMDPKVGRVWMDRAQNSAKQCDGKTLVYYGFGVGSGMTVRSSIPNSEECA